MNTSQSSNSRATWNKPNLQPILTTSAYNSNQSYTSSKPLQDPSRLQSKNTRQNWNKQNRYHNKGPSAYLNPDESIASQIKSRILPINTNHSIIDISAVKSRDFTDNPLLSNSKMWKHSPIRNESSSDDDLNASSICSFKSPDKKEEMSVADETICVSPIQKIQVIPTSRVNSRNDKKISDITNFHDNYLRLGLWPELSYTQQAYLRNSFKKNQTKLRQSREMSVNNSRNHLDYNKNMTAQYLQTSINNFPMNLDQTAQQNLLPPNGRKRATSLLFSQDNIQTQVPPYQMYQLQQMAKNIESKQMQLQYTNRGISSHESCQRCTSGLGQLQTNQSFQDENAEQYKEGLKKALELINTLIDQISILSENNQDNANNPIDQTNQSHYDDRDKENMYPTFNPRGLIKGNKLRNSQQELKDLVNIIKKAKQTNESINKGHLSAKNLQDTLSNNSRKHNILQESNVFKSFNNMANNNFSSNNIGSMMLVNMNDSQLPPKSMRTRKSPINPKETFNPKEDLETTRQSNNLMKQVLNQLHKLNQIKRGLKDDQKEHINKSVLGLCDLISQ
ncbi:UNKNOWN [Stylonychia lemnae]|uniref:Uncharacterized protein n=1 Tax=Stylonychia lemnae TaxID=5949 RepID=A0A078AY94_STYLE|nr:UNKNOWN [Stylonychia lemnae]|eukprot:CDW85768.1 UNKNOWN [Stylonychia lemnae]